MTTFADWSREILDAAEERGWAVILVDARANSVILEEPSGSGSIAIRISGRTLNAEFIRQLPEATVWARPPALRWMPDGTPCWCVSDEEPHEFWIHSPRCLDRRG
jgi:hypothetical protein